jgi:hypothetical protein
MNNSLIATEEKIKVKQAIEIYTCWLQKQKKSTITEQGTWSKNVTGFQQNQTG